MLSVHRAAGIAGVAMAATLLGLPSMPGDGTGQAAARSPAKKIAPAERPAHRCVTRSAQALAPTEHHARLAAWEKVAQATGNWPIQSDVFRSSRYRCGPAKGGIRCLGQFVVCRS